MALRTTPLGVVSPARPAAAPLLGHSSRPLEPEIASTRSLMLATAQRCELISELLGLPRSFDRQFVRNVLERFSPQHRGPAAEPAWNRLGKKKVSGTFFSQPPSPSACLR
jgi:hypothetical protein